MTPAQSAGLICPVTDEESVISYVAARFVSSTQDSGVMPAEYPEFAREMSLWLLRPALQAAALGHTVTDSTAPGGVEVWTCVDCRGGVYRAGAGLYGEAVRDACPRPLHPSGVNS